MMLQPQPPCFFNYSNVVLYIFNVMCSFILLLVEFELFYYEFEFATTIFLTLPTGQIMQIKIEAP